MTTAPLNKTILLSKNSPLRKHLAIISKRTRDKPSADATHATHWLHCNGEHILSTSGHDLHIIPADGTPAGSYGFADNALYSAPSLKDADQSPWSQTTASMWSHHQSILACLLEKTPVMGKGLGVIYQANMLALQLQREHQITCNPELLKTIFKLSGAAYHLDIGLLPEPNLKHSPVVLSHIKHSPVVLSHTVSTRKGANTGRAYVLIMPMRL